MEPNDVRYMTEQDMIDVLHMHPEEVEAHALAQRLMMKKLFVNGPGLAGEIVADLEARFATVKPRIRARALRFCASGFMSVANELQGEADTLSFDTEA